MQASRRGCYGGATRKQRAERTEARSRGEGARRYAPEMSHRATRLARSAIARSAIVAFLACLGASGAGLGAAQPAPVPTVSSPRGPRSIDRQVSAWLDRAGRAPHNGMNPQLELSPRLVVGGAQAFQRAVGSGPLPRRRDAAFALAQHPRADELRAFWRAQLDSDDADIRFRAVTELAEVHHPEDLEPLLRAYLAHEDLQRVVAVRVRDWHDRRAVIVLVELLGGPENIALNAAGSLAQSPDVPALDPEPTTDQVGAVHLPGGAWRAPPSSTVAPYRRWWSEQGRAAFATECAWWTTFAGSERQICSARLSSAR